MRCTNREAGRKEFLLDVVLYDRQTHRPESVLECEWKSVEDVRYDFQKLLWVKSPLKMMICDPQQEPELLLPTLMRQIMEYPDHLSGERYAVINLGGNPGGGETYLYIWPSTRPQAPDQWDVEGPFSYTLGKERRGHL